jgi:hypothetical protein
VQPATLDRAANPVSATNPAAQAIPAED